MTASSTTAISKGRTTRSRFTLSVKLVGCCVLLALLITASSCMIGYWKYRESTYEIYNSFAYDIAEVALTHVDGNAIASYLETGIKDEAYYDMAFGLYELYKSTTLSSIYICVPDAETLTIANIYDVRIHETKTPQYYDLGVVDPIGSNPDIIINIYETGNLSDDYFIRKTAHGYNTSAVMPVMNDAGDVTAILVVDVPMSLISTALREYLIFSVSISAAVVLIFVLFFVIYLRRRIVAPLRLITRETAEFIEEETTISDDLLKVRTGDEIEALAGSIRQMEIDINTYIDNLTSVTAEKERIGAELNVATQIQSSMLPCIFPAFPDRPEIDIYATMNPAKEVGGDFYDFFMVDDRHLAIVMADVSGKGVPAALFMVIGKTLIKDHTTPGRDLGEVFTRVNDLLCEANSEGLFITAFEGVLDLVTGEFNFVNAGHEMPFISRGGAPYEFHKMRAGFVLAGMEGMRYRAGSMTLEPGDKLFQYTDGVTEATNIHEELYGMDRLKAVLDRCCDKDPTETLPIIKEDIDRFVGEAPQFDDITMLCLEYKQRMQEAE